MYDELDRGVAWKDYLRSNIENRIKNKLIVVRDNIKFIDKPF